jgi:hypothetical protein
MMRIVTRPRITLTWAALAGGLVLLATTRAEADTVLFATADNGTTNLFGTLDVTTGLFTQVSTTTPLVGSGSV